MNWLERLRGQPTARETAKQRLQVILVHDRSDLSPGLLEVIKDEIIAVLSRHVPIIAEEVRVTVTQDARECRLVADIPLGNRHGRS
ncbi:MAG TPA: cell division topological specificity factor MinE [Thermoflexus sp.]|nr:cell division topological specificity factor MinE [Thermoflexus sp.]